MNVWLLPVGLVVIGVIIGAVLAATINRGRLRFAVDKEVYAAVLTARQPFEAELAQLRERAALLGQQRQDLQHRLQDTEARCDGWRSELDRIRDETAKLGERAQRVPELEEKFRLLLDELQGVIRERQQLTAELAGCTERASALNEQVTALTGDLQATEQRLTKTVDALNELNERKATLQATADRVPTLEQKLQETQRNLQSVGDELSQLRERTTGEILRLTTELSNSHDALVQARAQSALERETRADVERALLEAREQNGRLRTQLENDKTAATEKLQLLMDAKVELTNQFKALATDIFEDKSVRLNQQNTKQLEQLLDPLRTQISDFKAKVDDVYVKEGQERASLKTELQNLLQLNQTLSKEAHNLTRALKGDAKTRGNWGEMVLEKILEACGLREGIEYSRQESKVREDGSRAQADIIINLLEDRRMVVDSKVSLVAYEQYVAATADDQRDLAARRHIESIRAHISGLSDKQYQALYGLRSLDFVLMFVPIEPAYMLAIDRDNGLWLNAWQKNVMLVSPSTLLCVLRMVALLWRQEAQNRNAQDIARRGAELYDKLVLFMQDLQDVGKRLDAARDSYDAATKRLTFGKGNVLRQAEMLKDLGIKPTKSLVGPLFDRAMSSDSLIVQAYNGSSVDESVGEALSYRSVIPAHDPPLEAPDKTVPATV